jgi:hypothetical protein
VLCYAGLVESQSNLSEKLGAERTPKIGSFSDFWLTHPHPLAVLPQLVIVLKSAPQSLVCQRGTLGHSTSGQREALAYISISPRFRPENSLFMLVLINDLVGSWLNGMNV